MPSGPHSERHLGTHPRRRFAGIFLLSVSALLLQVTLTRVLSVALWYHFGFLVISTALLGFGASGSLLSVWDRLRERAELDRAMTAIALLYAGSTVICFWILQRVPFAPFSLLTDRAQLLWTPLYLLLIATPFFWAGLGIALLLTRAGDAVNRFYAWDLAGAGLGCLAVVAVIPRLGGSGAVVLAAAVGAASALAFALPGARAGATAAAAITAVLATAAPWAEGWLPIRVTANKPSRNAPVAHSEWDAFSKIDLLVAQADPESGRPAARRFRIDGGTAFTGMSDPRPWLERLERGAAITRVPPMRDMAVPLVGKDEPSVLVIGSGAGAEVLEALLLGARHVTALEINPIIARIVTRDPFWGGLFSRPDVTLYAEEGRSFVRRSSQTYDAIVSIHTISNAATAAGALDLAENYVLTRQAFDDFLDRLTPDGVLYFTRPEAHIPRLFSTAREALEARGIERPERHLYAWRSAPRQPGGRSFVAAFVLRKTPFGEAELEEMDARVLAGADTPNGVELLYTPARRQQDPCGSELCYATATELEIYRTLLTAEEPTAVWRSSSVQLAPATDDRPFFNHRTRWSGLTPAMFRDLLSQDRRGRSALEDRPIAEVTLVVLLAESALISALLILLPLVRLRRSGLRSGGAFRWLAYFSALGMGFILIEIVLIQRFTLFLGRPVFTFATVLAGLLVFSGLGAAWSERFGADPTRALRRVIPALLVVLLATGALAPALFAVALGWPLPVRVALTLLAMAPLGIALGMPFPLGLAAVQRSTPRLVPWTWGVNGFFTVIGTVVAVMLGMTVGFTGALVAAGGCYVLALVAVRPTSSA